MNTHYIHLHTNAFVRQIWLCLVLLIPHSMMSATGISRNMFILSNVNTEQGLSSARVYSIIQTEDGAMWISTKRGVDRYNGRQMGSGAEVRG